MELTGKCKEEFEKWFESLESKWWEYAIFDDAITFDDVPDSMMYGVYVDFFDSVGIYIDMIKTTSDGCMCDIYEHKSNEGHLIKKNTRPEARTEAIKKANEIYNEKR